MRSQRSPRRPLVPLLALAGVALTACGAQSAAGGRPAASSTGTSTALPSPSALPRAANVVTTRSTRAGEVSESGARRPRLGITYGGGVMVLDATTPQLLADIPAQGYLRLNPLGDERHLVLTEGNRFRVLDLGAWTEPHGDHHHRYTAAPRLTPVSFASDHPGHVVAHEGTTALYSDGSGVVERIPSDALLRKDTAAPRAERWTAPEAHHGVAVARKDGSLVTTVGTQEERSGVVVLDRSGAEVARTDRCPGVHGEAGAADGVITLGCTDGIVVVRGTTITKIDSPDPYGRIGNQRGHEGSPFVLGDYKVDEDAELERPTRVSITDTRDGSLRLVDLPASYSFRSLARGPKGEGIVLGTDGALRVIDMTTGSIARQIRVTSAWEEPLDWQDPRPAVHVQDGTAYVTEPATKALHLVDLDSGEVISTTTLPHVPDETSGTHG